MKMSEFLDDEMLDALVFDIASWGEFHLIFDDDSKSLAMEFQEKLKLQDVSCTLYHEEMLDIFESNISRGDALLVISNSGTDDFIIKMMKAALRKNIDVYAICSNRNGDIAFFASELIAIDADDDFKKKASVILDDICERVHSLVLDDAVDLSHPNIFYRQGETSPDVPEGSVLAPFSGSVVDVKVKMGDEVKVSGVLCTVESMKFESEVSSDFEGVVDKIFIQKADEVESDDILMIIKQNEHLENVDCDDSPEGAFHSPQSGFLVRMNVDVGKNVKKGDLLCIIEYFKMQTEIFSNSDGVVEEITAEIGDVIEKDDILMIIR